MLNRMTERLLDRPSIGGTRCCWCGEPATNRHHVVEKGMGGTALESRIPTVPLCGMGNASGCHGKAHAKRLWFDWRDGWFGRELTDEEFAYLASLHMGKVERFDVLALGGWRPL